MKYDYHLTTSITIDQDRSTLIKINHKPFTKFALTGQLVVEVGSYDDVSLGPNYKARRTTLSSLRSCRRSLGLGEQLAGSRPAGRSEAVNLLLKKYMFKAMEAN